MPGLAIDIRASVKTLRKMEKSGDPAVRGGGGDPGAAARRPVPRRPRRVATGGARRTRLAVMRRGRGRGNCRCQAAGGSRSALPVGVLPGEPAADRAVGAARRARPSAARRTSSEVTGSWTKTVRLGQKAMAEAERGWSARRRRSGSCARSTSCSASTRGSPATRRLIQTVAPFLPWALSAARFVFWTMPAHHTIKTALLLQSEQVVDAGVGATTTRTRLPAAAARAAHEGRRLRRPGAVHAVRVLGPIVGGRRAGRHRPVLAAAVGGDRGDRGQGSVRA
jgi:hypothetical protein